MRGCPWVRLDGRDETEGAHVVGESRHDQARIINGERRKKADREN